MADVELVIKIPKEVYEDIKDSNVIFRDDERTCYEAVQNGIPLPKGHGRLIDADDVNNHIIGFVNLSGCPTIIEADKERKNERT